MLKKIIKERGSTKRERHLARLSESSFFGLWSFPNVYTDEGFAKNKSGKELCDLLVVVGETAIIFSDKDNKFNSETTLAVAWSRWFTKSVVKSAGQLYGAEQWLKNHSPRVFLDKACKVPFPVSLVSIKKIHLICVTCNTSAAFSKNIRGGSPSFIQNYSFGVDSCKQTPFVVGDLYPNKTFVHVFDENSLDLVMSELNAIADFIHYLDEKERSIRGGFLGSAVGEEAILAEYLSNRSVNSLTGSLISLSQTPEGRMKNLSNSEWSSLSENTYYLEVRNLLRSYDFLDKLIDRISYHILAGEVGLAQDLPFEMHERAVRELSLEPRISRALLSQAFIDKFEEVPENRRSSRMVGSLSDKNKVYIFLFLPRDRGQSDADYREERQNFNHIYAFVAKSIHPHFKRFVVISTEPKGNDRRSEDIYVVDYPVELNVEEIKIARELQEKDRILSNTWVGRSNLISGVHRNPGQFRNFSPKYGRNEPCPCGSGAKYKRCCIDSR